VFDASLDDPRWLWLAATRSGLQPLRLPPPGKAMRVDVPPLPEALEQVRVPSRR
jgi:hypothetical protein